MDEKKPKNKKVIIIIAVIGILVLVAVGGIGLVVNETAQKAIIGVEMESINSTGNIDSEIKSKGKYAEVEKALKDYLTEYKNVALEIANEYQNQNLTTILSAENFKNDGPNFETSKKLINDIKEKGENAKTKLAEMSKEEYKEKRATDSGLTGKYKDLFKSSVQLENDAETVNKTVENVNNYLDKINEVFDFLKESEGKWQINGEKIEFRDMSNLTKYNSLLTSVNTAASKIK
ncbi:MAG: DUF3053 family protein [Clostridia bacterium]|nr:DUF3053 family protein [Clostridia bacterium]